MIGAGTAVGMSHLGILLELAKPRRAATPECIRSFDVELMRSFRLAIGAGAAVGMD